MGILKNLAARWTDGNRDVTGRSMMMAQAFFADLANRDVILETVPYAINIGCGDGRDFEDPVYPLYVAGFKGVAIDGWNHQELRANLGHLDVILKPATPLSADNVVAILAEAKCPSNPSFLKIDIDGFDADILRAVLDGGIRPSVIQAEVHTEIPPPYAFAVCASSKYRGGSEKGFYGFSLSYGEDLLSRYGYAFYALDFETGWTHDALWVHRSVLKRAGLSAADPIDAFMSRDAHLYVIETASKETLLSWRVRTDLTTVRDEIWQTMLMASEAKLGHRDSPFELYISKPLLKRC